MADVLTTDQRSYNMSQIKSVNTLPEMLLKNILISNGVKDFKSHPKNILGHPDLYFPNKKHAVFVDGCFWHACPDCFQEPQTNIKFWRSKINANIKRDLVVNKKLKALGIKVTRIREHDLKKNPIMILGTLEKELLIKSPPRVLDLFAGAGGLSEGFIRAGFQVISHIEMDKNTCDTLNTRMLFHALRKKGKLKEYKRYILGKVSYKNLIEKYNLQRESDTVICAKITKDNYLNLIDQVKIKLNGKSLDVIVGGPPCQAYSYIGRVQNSKKGLKDERNYLYKYYIKFIKAFKPKIFLFENVPGIVSAGKGEYLRDMRKQMLQAGYTTNYTTLNAADYGVPQNRKRVILIGWSKDSKIKCYPNFPVIKRKYTVKSFLIDLPKIKAGGGLRIRKYTKNNKLLEKLGIKNKEFDILLDHISRPNTQRDLKIYQLAVIAKQKGENIRYNLLPDELKTHNNENAFLDRFKVVDEKATGSHTILAHIAKDGHYYIHPDLKQNRSLTVREAARLQTFPDDYKFEGERSSQFKQIGNAVPPMLSENVAKELIKYL